jgi:tetratricopeptide (TPR) repeat protein
VALHLDDRERARELFRTAGSLSAGRVGPPLGRYFTAARQGEPPDQVDPIAALAPIAGGAEAALWLRSAAIHEVNGDRDTAAAHVGSALVASPDDAGALVVAAEFAPVAANGDATVWRKRAELMRRRAELCDDPITRDHWDLESAEALERAGQLHDAGRVIGEVLGRRPDNMRALQALRRLCRRGGDRATLAMASLSLARVLGDRESQLALLREAAAILDREQGNVEAAVPVYRRVVAVEPFGAEYDRLHDIYVDNEDLGGLFDLLSDRLNLLEDAAAKVPVWIERARARCALGDVAGAARDLEAALAEDANRADAIREHGRVLVALGQPKRAAAALRRYLELVDDPAARADAELELSQLLAEAMDDPAGAIAQLDAVLVQKPDDIELRERMVALLLRAGDAQRAVDEVRAIEKLRGAPPERARDELRIARLYRDELGKRDRARKALERARQLDPRNIDAVRELAELATDGKDRGRILRHAASDARAAIAEAPMNAPGYERLAVIAQWMDDADARYFAVGGLAAVGTVPAEHKEFAAAHAKVVRGRALASGSPVSADDWTTRLRHARGGGIAGELWLAIAEAVGSLLPHEPSLLGFGRGDRVGGRHFERDFPAVHAVTTAFGVPGFDLYVSSEKEKYARVVSFDKPVVYLSADVAAAKTPEAAFALGRAMAMARDGTGALADLRGDEVTAMFAAAAVIAGVDPGSVDAIAGVAGEAHDERVKAMNKAIARRAKKNLAVLASRFGELAAPHEWARAMMSTAARAGVLVAGDLGAALDVLDVGRGGRALADDPWALDLLAWAVGEDHLALRTKLGLRG